MHSESNIVIYHIGGGDDQIGPTSAIINSFPDYVDLVLFDAREDSTDIVVDRFMSNNGIQTKVVNVGISGKSSSMDFYINTCPLSSSLLPPSQQSLYENPSYSHVKTWGDNVILDRKVKVNTYTLNDIVDNIDLPPPTFLSIDAQGAELEILKGANKFFSSMHIVNGKKFESGILGLMTECEYSEIYEGQGLFHEQMAFLENYNFRLVEIYSSQYWHPTGRTGGKGFLTVSENLFLKSIYFGQNNLTNPRAVTFPHLYSPDDLLKLAMISYSFERYSYSLTLIDYLKSFHTNFYIKMILKDKRLKKLKYFHLNSII